MSGPLEPVGLRFRGHERALPLLAIAIAFRRSLERTVTTLEILIQGPPELRALPPAAHDSSPPVSPVPALPLLGEGVGGGERSERSETMNVNVQKENIPNVQRSERERRARENAAEGTDLALRLARELGDEENLAAIRKLTRTYPEELLHEALRRTLAVPSDRVRGSRGALFTGIVRKLAAESPSAPNP